MKNYANVVPFTKQFNIPAHAARFSQSGLESRCTSIPNSKSRPIFDNALETTILIVFHNCIQEIIILLLLLPIAIAPSWALARKVFNTCNM